MYTSNFDLTAGFKFREGWLQTVIQNRETIGSCIDASQGIFKSVLFLTAWKKMKKVRISFIGDHENCNSYSTMLIKIEEFKDFGKAYTHTEACKKWFDKIIVGEDLPIS